MTGQNGLFLVHQACILYKKVGAVELESSHIVHLYTDYQVPAVLQVDYNIIQAVKHLDYLYEVSVFRL